MTIYTPTVWHSNDLITSEKLNKIEDRIEELQNIQINFTSPPSYNEVLALLNIGIFPRLNDAIIYETVIINDTGNNVTQYGYSLTNDPPSYVFNDQDSHEPIYVGYIGLEGGGDQTAL